MAYDDGYYYGQCKIVAVVDNTADDGKTVLITTDDNKTYSGTIANKKCEFLLPPRTLYTVQKVSSGSAEFTTKVEAGYGDCILVHLDTGYVEVKQGDIVGLDYIKAATNDNLKNKVPEAKAVKELNSSLTASDNLKFRFATDGEGNYGYLRADDSFVPFKSGGEIIKIASGLSGANSNNVNCTNISGYQNLTNANFFAKATGSTGFHTESSFGGASMSYNSSTGQLAVGKFGVQIGGYCNVYIYDVYCCTGEIK